MLGKEVLLCRQFADNTMKKEAILMANETDNHRFIISRSHPAETDFYVAYPNEAVLEAFIIDDRAYYPTESFYRS